MGIWFFNLILTKLTLEHDDECADDHEYGLDEVCPDDGGEPAKDGEEGGQREEDEDGHVEAAKARQPKGQLDEQSASIQIGLQRIKQ